MATIQGFTGSGAGTMNEILSTQHVRVNTEGIVSIELPFFDGQYAQSVYVRLGKDEALQLAARITSLVALSL